MTISIRLSALVSRAHFHKTFIQIISFIQSGHQEFFDVQNCAATGAAYDDWNILEFLYCGLLIRICVRCPLAEPLSPFVGPRAGRVISKL